MPRPTTFPEPWRSLCSELERRWLADHSGQSCPGGVTLAAEALHSDTSTVRRWATGDRTPGGPAQALIEALFRKHSLEPPTW